MHSRATADSHPGVVDQIAYSPPQAAAASSLSLRTITAAIASGELRSFRLGRRRIVFRTDLDAYLRSEITSGAAPESKDAVPREGMPPSAAGD
jgi:excisionase family DNA binding protein